MWRLVIFGMPDRAWMWPPCQERVEARTTLPEEKKKKTKYRPLASEESERVLSGERKEPETSRSRREREEYRGPCSRNWKWCLCRCRWRKKASGKTSEWFSTVIFFPVLSRVRKIDGRQGRIEALKVGNRCQWQRERLKRKTQCFAREKILHISRIFDENKIWL